VVDVASSRGLRLSVGRPASGSAGWLALGGNLSRPLSGQGGGGGDVGRGVSQGESRRASRAARVAQL
jgi:hypothetical protein